MKILFVSVLLLVLWNSTVNAQRDSLQQLPEIVVQSYFSKSSLQRVPTTVNVLTPAEMQLQPGISLLPALNTIPGMHMEERSPGSYRLSIRGSLLRSPFGIRNIKIYVADMPLTDAGGNAYLNLIDPDAVCRVEVLKGPDGSLFGANAGGVVRLDLSPPLNDSQHLQVKLQGGSYGLYHHSIGWQQAWKNYHLQLFQGYQRSDGYRDNTALKRFYTQITQRWEYKPGHSMKLLAFYADLNYRTPGGLTLLQSKNDPRAARPATATLPGAVTQQAGVSNRTFQGGLTHEAQLVRRLQHVLSVFTANTHFENPFITNYEARDENTAGLRTYLQWVNDPLMYSRLKWSWVSGVEWQQTTTDVVNYGNRMGKRDTLQRADKIKAGQHFFFTRFQMVVNNLTVEAATSVNYYRYLFNKNEYTKINYSPQWMPRISVSYLFTPAIAGRFSVSRGYSPPATAEIRASNNVINTTLYPETGWNYEAGIRIATGNQFRLDAAVFNYRMLHAIVRKLNDNNEEFFVNAGGIRQHGVEIQSMYYLLPFRRKGICRGVKWQESYTFSDFRFIDYVSSGKDFSDNMLTGVPEHILVSSLLCQLPAQLSVYAQHTFTSRIPLNDGNSVFANSYHLVQAKVSWKIIKHPGCDISWQAGVDNLLNVDYSLGNDLNAAGNRFYNPSPKRNYYASVILQW